VWPVRPAVTAPRDTAALLASLAGRPELVPYTLRLRGLTRIARGDTAGADSAWAALATLDSPWAWEALRARLDSGPRHGDPARADSLLAAATGTPFAPLDRAAWLVRRARARLALGDSAGAFRFALEVVHGDPALTPAVRGLETAESLAGAGVGTLSDADQIAAADVEARNGRTSDAVRRLEALMRAHPERAFEFHMKVAGVQRLARSWTRVERALADALHEAPTASAKARVWIERARVDALRWRTEGARDAAETALAVDPAGPHAAEASAERAIALERLGDLAGARRAWMAAAGGGPAADDAAMRAAVLWLAAGRPDSARRWVRGDGDAASFWRAVLTRRVDRRAGDSLLRRVALRPGYTFHRVAARETLGIAPWTGQVAVPACDADGCARLSLAAGLAGVGADDEALRVLYRWAADHPNASPGAWLEAARVAHRAGRVPTAILYARNAAAAAGQADSDADPLDPADGDAADPPTVTPRAARADSVAWAVAAWIHPPAFDSLYARVPALDGGRVDADLARGVTWQESHFDPRARSSSNAIGLMQLMRPTAAEVAGWLRLRRPTAAALEDPGLNVRLGTRYLSHLIERFDGNVVAALGAYNTGASRMPESWREIVAAGGDALLAELLPEPARTYAKRVLTARAAYRELGPRAVPSGR